MQLHHDKHHRTYVNGANQALDELYEAQQKNDFTKIAMLERALAFNVSGHILHSIFWQNLSPDGNGQPQADLANQIKHDFGSFPTFKNQLIRAASTIMGSGWAALTWDPVSNRLITNQIHDHQSETAQGSVPLLVLDAWEHAYYLQYQTDKNRYFEAIWNLWNWNDVAQRFGAAQSVDLRLEQAAEQPGAAPPSVH